MCTAAFWPLARVFAQRASFPRVSLKKYYFWLGSLQISKRKLGHPLKFIARPEYFAIASAFFTG